MYSEEIINILQQNNWKSPKGCGFSKQIKNEIFIETLWLDKFYNKIDINHRIYVIKNNIFNVPKCKSCDNNASLNFAYRNKGFQQYCSPNCSRKNAKSNNLQLNFLTKEWLYQKRIVERLPIERIAEICECSIQPIYTKLKEYNIEKINAKQKYPDAIKKLEDKEWLYDQYVMQNKNIRQIAKELGYPNNRTGSVWEYLKSYDIECRASNSYENVGRNKPTKPEIEIVEFIKTFYNGNIINGQNKNILEDNRDIDIYIPDKNLAIEYNGLQAHIYRPHKETACKRRDKNYHISKTDKCELKGIQLLHIYSDEWINTKDIVKSMIKSKLGYSDNKIYARQCEVREISTKIKNIFLNRTHIQGKDNSSLKLGLFYNNELVSIMTFKQNFFNSKLYDFELSRFSSKLNTNVIGGFSKLLKASEKFGVKGKVVSYADRRISMGNVYIKNGFTHITTNKPGYDYVPKKMDRRFYRLEGTKAKLEKLGAKLYIDNKKCTEEEMASQIGWAKIFNCGTLTFVKVI